MGWLLREGTTAVVLLLVTLALSPRSRRWLRRAARAVGHLVPRPAPPPVVDRRRFELVVHDLRRLHHRYAATRTGVSFAKAEAVRRAYDDALAEGCAALEVTHLLGVLDGEELDRERIRVERLLHRWGLALDDAA